MSFHQDCFNARSMHETFYDYENELEVLEAIRNWWKEAEPKYPIANIHLIEIHHNDKECKAEVYWTYIEQEIVDELERRRGELTKLTEPVEVSSN